MKALSVKQTRPNFSGFQNGLMHIPHKISIKAKIPRSLFTLLHFFHFVFYMTSKLFSLEFLAIKELQSSYYLEQVCIPKNKIKNQFLMPSIPLKILKWFHNHLCFLMGVYSKFHTELLCALTSFHHSSFHHTKPLDSIYFH